VVEGCARNQGPDLRPVYMLNARQVAVHPSRCSQTRHCPHAETERRIRSSTVGLGPPTMRLIPSFLKAAARFGERF